MKERQERQDGHHGIPAKKKKEAKMEKPKERRYPLISKIVLSKPFSSKLAFLSELKERDHIVP